MKALTHYIFSVGISFALLSLFQSLSPLAIIMALWLAFSINYLIDALGHTSRNDRPSRTRLTHSIFTAPLWGGLVALVSIVAVSQASGSGPSLAAVGFWAIFGALVAGEHLFLDSLTQAGVYSWNRRIAIAHFSYDNTALNLGFALLGVVLIMAALGV